MGYCESRFPKGHSCKDIGLELTLNVRARTDISTDMRWLMDLIGREISVMTLVDNVLPNMVQMLSVFHEGQYLFILNT